MLHMHYGMCLENLARKRIAVEKGWIERIHRDGVYRWMCEWKRRPSRTCYGRGRGRFYACFKHASTASANACESKQESTNMVQGANKESVIETCVNMNIIFIGITVWQPTIHPTNQTSGSQQSNRDKRQHQWQGMRPIDRHLYSYTLCSYTYLQHQLNFELDTERLSPHPNTLILSFHHTHKQQPFSNRFLSIQSRFWVFFFVSFPFLQFNILPIPLEYTCKPIEADRSDQRKRKKRKEERKKSKQISFKFDFHFIESKI